MSAQCVRACVCLLSLSLYLFLPPSLSLSAFGRLLLLLLTSMAPVFLALSAFNWYVSYVLCALSGLFVVYLSYCVLVWFWSGWFFAPRFFCSSATCLVCLWSGLSFSARFLAVLILVTCTMSAGSVLGMRWWPAGKKWDGA